MAQSRKSDCLFKRLLALFHVTGTGILLSLTLLLPQLLQPQTVAFAASQPIPAPTHQIGNGPMAPPHLSAQNIADGNEKQLLAKEYMSMLAGKESMATYEQHMTSFMQKHNLGNVGNLHKVLIDGPRSKLQGITKSINLL